MSLDGETLRRMPRVKGGAVCCGCTGCAAVCPTGALTMQPDAAGFLYPQLDADKCIGCLRCERVCDFVPRQTPPVAAEDVFPLFYGARQKDIAQVMRSRSGAVFPALAGQILSAGGVVYGAALEDDFTVRHRRVDTADDLGSLRGSKYVQSDMRGIFRSVKADLVAGRKVLFSGTPCQVATLLKYVPRRLHDIFYTVDIVCHGVPGPNYWKEFLRFVERKAGRKIKRVIFRDKERHSWKRHQEMFVFEGSDEPVSMPYRFYSDIMFRPSCGACPFATVNRPADVTLADFWGYERTGTHLNDDNKGLNMVIVSTAKGARMFEAVKPQLEWFATDAAHALQDNLRHSTPRAADADRFARAFGRHGFARAFNSYGIGGRCCKVRKLIKVVKRRLGL